MTQTEALIAGLAISIGFWIAVVGLRQSPLRVGPSRESALPGMRRLMGLAPGGALWERRWVLLGGIAVGLAVGLATGWYVLALVVPTASIGLPALFRRTTSSDEAERLADLTAWVRSLLGVLAGGAVGLEQGIRATVHAAPAGIRSEVARLAARLDAQQPLKPALRRWADEMNDHSADLVAAVLILEADNRAGAITAALRRLADSLGARAKARRDIETERASSRATVRWVTIVTIVVLGVTAAAGYMGAYGSPLGQMIALVLFTAYVGCLVWMRKIAQGRPIPRFLPETRRGE